MKTLLALIPLALCAGDASAARTVVRVNVNTPAAVRVAVRPTASVVVGTGFHRAGFSTVGTTYGGYGASVASYAPSVAVVAPAVVAAPAVQVVAPQVQVAAPQVFAPAVVAAPAVTYAAVAPLVVASPVFVSSYAVPFVAATPFYGYGATTFATHGYGGYGVHGGFRR